MKARPKAKTVVTVDLFCGAGGESTGMGIAVKRCGLKQIGIAINHWERAVQTMMMNHPDISTYEMDIMTAIPAELVPGGVVDLLHASPSCTHHSRAATGKLVHSYGDESPADIDALRFGEKGGVK